MTNYSLRALIFGSIGTLVETSELQRQAFNEAFEAAGLDWNWDRRSYQDMLHAPGGRARIELFARARGEAVDAAAIHADKTARFDETMLRNGLELRPGVADTIAWAKEAGLKLGFATSTTPENVRAVLEAADGLSTADFNFIGDSDQVEAAKPDPAVYELALRRLDVSPEQCVAVEDTGANLPSATMLGIPTIGFPGANALDQDYSAAALIVDTLTPSAVERAFSAVAAA